MKALTLWQPWAWALFHGKPVENRPWRPSDAMIGQRIAIHAGKTFDHEGAAWVQKMLGLDSLPMAAAAKGVVGVATIDRFVRDDITGPDANDPILDSPWMFGPWGWVLRAAVELDAPIRCAGALSLWSLPETVERELAARLAGPRCVAAAIAGA
jgi:hypothetical protein